MYANKFSDAGQVPIFRYFEAWCFLTYICNYLFLFHTLVCYINFDGVFHLMEVLLYQACENGYPGSGVVLDCINS